MPVHVAAALRTPFTRSGGALAGWHPVDLAAELLRRPEFRLDDVDELYVGCAEPVGAQGANLARAAVLAAGGPDRLGGTVIDRAETSGTAALHAACAAIASGAVSTAIVLGVCSASVVPPGASALARTYGRPWGDGPARRLETEGGLLPGPVAAERAARAAGITRAAQDAWADTSLDRRTDAAPNAITTVAALPGDAAPLQRGTPVTRDDLRSAPDDPGALPPSFDPDGTVTAHSFSPPADGVAVLALTAEPVGPEIIGTGRGAGHPLDPVGGVVDAVDRAAAGRRGEVTDWELTEPTAAAALLAVGRLGLDPEAVNRHGGTLAVGDAGAAEELRLLVDVIGRREPGLVLALAHGLGGAAATLLHTP
jgi:acetyl-CoA acetyltransferase